MSEEQDQQERVAAADAAGVSPEPEQDGMESGGQRVSVEWLKPILEALLLAAGKPLSLKVMAGIFDEEERPDNDSLRAALEAIATDCADRGFELKEVASGFRFQVRQSLASRVSRLWDEKPQRYTRAMLETLALVAYRQPITRGDIEEIRGVGVSSTIIRTLMDREWIRIVGHRDVPGRPAMFATTRQFLDYFNLKSLQDLPPLSEIRDLDQLNRELALDEDPGDSRVLDLPDEEGPDTGEAREEDSEDRELPAYSEDELPDEEEAMALAKRPLDEILNEGREQNEGQEQDDDEDTNHAG